MTATLELPRQQQPAPVELDGSHLIPTTARAIFTPHDAVMLEFTTDDCRKFADEGHWVLISYEVTGLACTIRREATTYCLETYAQGLVQRFDYPYTNAGWQQLIDHSQLHQRDDWLLATVSAKEAVVDEDWHRTSNRLRSIRDNHVPCALELRQQPRLGTHALDRLGALTRHTLSRLRGFVAGHCPPPAPSMPISPWSLPRSPSGHGIPNHFLQMS